MLDIHQADNRIRAPPHSASCSKWTHGCAYVRKGMSIEGLRQLH